MDQDVTSTEVQAGGDNDKRRRESTVFVYLQQLHEMESPPGPDHVEGDHEDSNSLESVETGTSASIIDGETPTISSPETATDFLPIKTEIKKMGVEISDERAEQLKNDVRRLSPEVVSLRERTLGEISLTPDSSFFELEEDLPQGDEKNEVSLDPLLSRLIGEPTDTESPATSVKCEYDVVRGQELVISGTDLSAGEASGSEVLVVIDDRTDRELEKAATFIHQDEAVPQQNAAVIQKLAEDEEIVFAGANVPHVQLQSSFSSSSSSSSSFTSSSSCSPTTTTTVPSFMVAYPEASPCSSSEGPDLDPLRDHPETETDSDSSEPNAVLNPGTDLESDFQRLQDADPTQRNIISCERIIEAEQFTEDSAESLALASGNRDEVRSDGSDSGLGGEIVGDTGNPGPAAESDSETSFLDRIPDEILGDKDKTGAEDTMVSCEIARPVLSANPILPALRSPPKSNLKRRLTDCMEGEPNPKRSNSDESQKKKRNIQFDAVTVYYFPRAQGFTCVPSQGGSTLGMSAAHTHAERFSLTEHAAEQRRIHRARLAQLRSERAANNVVEAASSSEDPSDDTDEEPSDTEELDIDSYYFLLPVPTWQRRALLRAAGVQKIDTVEKDECRDIRASRKHCGCGCKGYCDPESCPCSRAHVKCQVDRAGFPCGCSRDGCANSSGRIEFNPVRVRTHFIHTLMRLELEKKHRDEDCGELRDLDAPPPIQGPLRDVRGLPVVGMQDQVADGSCGMNGMNGSGFTTLHYPTTQPEITGAREDSLDLYAIRDDCYPTSEDPDPGQQSHHRKLLHPGEFGQPFPFHGPVNNQQFQQNAYQDYQGYQTLPSTSRGQFHHPQFQQQPHHGGQGFPHYGGYGVAEGVMPGCHQPQNVYEANFPDDGAPSQYTNLNSVQPLIVGGGSHHQSIAKLEPFSELLAGRYSYYGEIEPTQSHVAYHQTGPSNGKGDAVEKTIGTQESPVVEEERNGSGSSVNVAAEDCDENFGEIIKKSMVETVSA